MSGRKASQRGAVALEYILLMALVAMALIAVFKAWGKATSDAVANVAVNSSGALQDP